MLLISLITFVLFFFLLIKSSDYATKYASNLARDFHVSEFILSFVVVAVISALPETAISIISTFEGVPELGLATLLGSNVADLTLVFGIVALFSARGIVVRSQILRRDFLYLLILVVPVLLGLDGNYSRIDALVLIISAILFFITLIMETKNFQYKQIHVHKRKTVRNMILLLLSMACVFGSAHFTVHSATRLANDLNIPQILIGLVIISIGTCLPELLFSIKSVSKNHDGLAIGDILGTVIIDATIIIGINALIKPFSFDPRIVYVTGTAMVLAACLTIFFIKSQKNISKKEGLALLLFYILFVIVQTLVK